MRSISHSSLLLVECSGLAVWQVAWRTYRFYAKSSSSCYARVLGAGYDIYVNEAQSPTFVDTEAMNPPWMGDLPRWHRRIETALSIQSRGSKPLSLIWMVVHHVMYIFTGAAIVHYSRRRRVQVAVELVLNL